MASRFKGLQIDACPFANLPEKKRTMWALTKEELKTVSGSNLSRRMVAFEVCRAEGG